MMDFGTQAQRPFISSSSSRLRRWSPDYLCMVIPARWFSGGMGLDEFRESMLADDRLRSIDDYLTARRTSFPGWASRAASATSSGTATIPDSCRVTTHFKDEPPSTATRPLLEEGVDVFIRFNEGLSILKKVVAVETGSDDSLSFLRAKKFRSSWSASGSAHSGSTPPSGAKSSQRPVT